MLQKACIPPLGLVWYMGQAMNSSTLPLERERTGTTSMTSGNLTLGASQLFCLINYANISFINRLNFYYLSCFVLCLWILCFDMFVIFRSEEWKELGRTNRYHLIYKHGLHLKKNVYTLVSSFSKLELCFWLQTTIERPLLSQASVWGLGRSISREFQVLRPPGNLGY